MAAAMNPFVFELYDKIITLPYIRLALHLDLIQTLACAGRRVSVEELTEQLSHFVVPDFTSRLLRILCTADLIVEEPTGCFLTQRGHQLYLGRAFITVMFDEVLRPMVDLPDFVDEHGDKIDTWQRKSRWINPSTFRDGTTDTDFFANIAQDREREARFHEGMKSMENLHPWLVIDFETHLCDWIEKASGNKFLVDVGGGEGNFIESLLQRHSNLPGSAVVLQDLPSVVSAVAREQRPGLSNVEIHEYDFFAGTQPVQGAHIYNLRACLHDYDDTACITILRNIRSAMSMHSRLIISENVILREAPLDIPAVKLDGCLVCFGGRVRMLEDFERLFEDAELKLVQHHRTPGSSWSMLEASI